MPDSVEIEHCREGVPIVDEDVAYGFVTGTEYVPVNFVEVVKVLVCPAPGQGKGPTVHLLSLLYSPRFNI